MKKLLPAPTNGLIAAFVLGPLSKSLELTPLIVYGTTVLSGTLVVVNVNVVDSPSFNDDELTPNAKLAAGVILVSLIVTLSVLDCQLSRTIAIVSAPSVSASSVIVNGSVAVFEVIVKLPVRLASLISALVTPLIVYGTLIASLTPVVTSVIVTVPPSLTLSALLDSEYVAAGVKLVSLIVTVCVASPLLSASCNISVPSVPTSGAILIFSVAVSETTVKLAVKGIGESTTYPDEPAIVGSPTSPSWNMLLIVVSDGLLITSPMYELNNA